MATTFGGRSPTDAPTPRSVRGGLDHSPTNHRENCQPAAAPAKPAWRRPARAPNAPASYDVSTPPA